MLLSVLVSTASASEAPTPVLPEPPSPASAWSTPPQLSVSASRLHTHTQMVSTLGSMAVIGAAGISAWAIGAGADERSIAGANVVVFAVPGAVLGAMTLLPAMQLASEGVRWAPTLGIASIAAGLTSVALATNYDPYGSAVGSGIFLAAGLAWASPLLALSEVLMASRAGWQAQGSEVSFTLLPTGQGGRGSVTWSF